MIDVETNESSILSSIIRELIDNYHYDVSDITVHVEVARGMQADAVVYSGTDVRMPIIIVEAKIKLLYPLGIEQLASVMRAMEAPYGILTDGTRRHYFKMIKGEPIEIMDIPRKGEPDNPRIGGKSEMPFQYALNQAYGVIKTREPLTPIQSIRELNKLLFVAIHASRRGDSPSMKDDMWNMLNSARGQSPPIVIHDLFESAKMAHPNIFPKEDLLKIRSETALTAFQYLIRFEYSPSVESSMQYLDFLIKETWSMGQFLTPLPVATLMAGLANPRSGDRILDPACGSGSLLLMLIERGKTVDNSLQYVGMDTDLFNIELCYMNLLLAGDDNTVLSVDEFLRMKLDNGPRYDVIAIDPPLGRSVSDGGLLINYDISGHRKRVDSYALFIEKGLKSLVKGGRMVVTVPRGMLFSQSAAILRKYLLENTRILGIINLPKGAYLPYSGVGTTLLILEQEKKGQDSGDVFMAQLSSLDKPAVDLLVSDFQAFRVGVRVMTKYISIIRQDELADKWDPRSYQTDSIKITEHHTRLGLVAKITKGVKVPSSEYFEEGSKGGIPYIRISDMIGGVIDFTLARRIAGNHGTILIQPGDVLLSASGTIGKIALATNENEIGVPSAQIFVLKANPERVLPDYLAMVLMSSSVQQQLDAKKTGQYISYLSITDLREILLPVPDLSKQRDLVTQYHLKVSDLNKPSQKELCVILDKLLEVIIDG